MSQLSRQPSLRLASRVAPLLCTLALAASAQTNRWPLPYSPSAGTGPIQVDAYSSAGTQLGLSQTSINAALTGAMNAWNGASCLDGGVSYMKLQNAGTSAAATTTDQISVAAIVVTSSTDPNYRFFQQGAEVLPSVAVPLSYQGTVYACDILLNRFDYPGWDTAAATPSSAFDVQSRLTYELGRCLGLDATVSSVDVMNPAGKGEQKRTLSPDDQAALCAAYPTGGYGSPCSADTGCDRSTGLHCVASALADGGTSSKYCSAGCNYVQGNGNSCAPPFACQPTTAVKQPSPQPFTSSGACLINANPVVQVGNPCTTGALNCSGIGNGTCLPSEVAGVDSQLPSGYPAWKYGYCTQDCSTAKCPSGSACYPLGEVDGGAVSECLRLCRTATDCRADYSDPKGPFYACSPLGGLDGGYGACIPACHSDSDCGSNAYCRTCDGVCIPRQQPSIEIGDPCNSPTDCGIGQVCIKFPASTIGVCSAPCDTACSACPNGSTCHSVGASGENYCLRDCVDGTCGKLQQCAYVSGGNGRGCEPQCTGPSDCPSGLTCSGGQCSPSNPDAGACDLCFVKPSTTPPGGTTPDAGVHGVTGGGCGCESGPGVLAVPLVLFLFSMGARRRWPNPRP